MSRNDEVELKRDENAPPMHHCAKEARSQSPRPVGASALPFGRLNKSPHSSRGVSGKDRLRQFCRRVLQSPTSPLSSPRGQKSPQVALVDCTKPKLGGHADIYDSPEVPVSRPPVQHQQPSGIARPTGHASPNRPLQRQHFNTCNTNGQSTPDQPAMFYADRASPKVTATPDQPFQHQQPSSIPRATGGDRTCQAGRDYRIMHSTPNVSPGLAASPAAAGGAAGSADTSTSSGGPCIPPSVVPDLFSPDFEKYREMFRQDLQECYLRDRVRLPFTSSDDSSPGLTPPHPAPLSATGSVRDVRQIVAIPLPDSPAHYNDEPSGMTPPPASASAAKSICDVRQIVAVPLPVSPAHYVDSPEQLKCSPTEFQLPASVTWKRRRQRVWRRSSATPPETSPGVHTGYDASHSEESPRSEVKDSSNGDGLESDTSHGGNSPAVNPSPVLSSPTETTRDGAMSSLLPSPPPRLTWPNQQVWLPLRHRLSTVMECTEEISCSTLHGTTAPGPFFEESLLVNARQPPLVDATFGAWMTTAMASQLDGLGEEEIPEDLLSDSLASFIENERLIKAQFRDGSALNQ